MGLFNNFPNPTQGLFPDLVMNTLLSMQLLVRNMLGFMLQVWVVFGVFPNSEDHPGTETSGASRRRVITTRFEALCMKSCTLWSGRSTNGYRPSMVECCVCLCVFKEGEEVSELSCKHVFHKGCLEEWFQNQKSCPLCRLIL